ncbi:MULTISPECIES: DUF262 domain-containing protein [Myroides]|uniref:DUF262 domain-containing protein n=1 Tax=Myroides albus TaxID=2562892 RepID=A0A6I3LKT7_9FLAO|nr:MULTISPECIES: DUF262 domain-containing protein [Myroides]MTG98434.1 DUF262 domain-containing protein [Myroides albus]MVX35046.1 DUF262 domain-containing protein [Myroides sp. LoEW2-1]UVD79653.1 DUF262 domain-containing protein [Myroides albus]
MNIIAFEEVFKDRIFRIPDYQRGYSWTKKELSELWYDLYNTHHHRNTFHFTGILTLNAFTTADFESIRKEGFTVRSNKLLIKGQFYTGCNIVDGQQRLTTLLILLSELVNVLDNVELKAALENTYFRHRENEVNKYIFGYHIDVPSHNYLIREIFSEKDYQVEETETLYTHNLSIAKTYFYQQVKSLSQVEVEVWINKITKHLLFSILDLSESQERPLDVSMVFETLNFRGKQLSSLERLKNRVLYIVSKQLTVSSTIDRSRKKVNQAWLEVYKWLGRNPSQAMDDDAFLKAFWLLYFSNSTMVSNDFKSYQKQLFTVDFQLEKDNELINYVDYKVLNEWLGSMKKAVVLWYFINNPYAVDTDIDFDFHYTVALQKSLLRINNFPRGYGKYMLNLILSIFMRDLPQKSGEETDYSVQQKLDQIERLLFAIERHNIMCFLLQGNNSNLNLEDTFRDINFYYLRGRAHTNEYLINVLLEQRVSHFRWKEVINHIHKGNRFKTWAGLDYFLKTIEELNGGGLSHVDPKVYLIYPEEGHYEERSTYKDINSMQKVNRDRYSYSLGNMILAFNRYEPSSFERIQHKIENAVKHEYRLTELEKEILSYETWDKYSIEDRGRKMMEQFISHWELPDIQDTEMRRLLLYEV